MKDDIGTTFTQEANVDVVPEKSKLTVTYANVEFVPLLRLGQSKKSVRLGAGVYGGYRLGSYSKIKYETNNLNVKDKERDGFYTNNLRYGVRARFGFKDIDLFANYDLNHLFVDGKGPADLNVISVGFILGD